DADSASSGFAALVFAWAGLACSGLASVSAVACSTPTVSRSAEALLLLFAGRSAAELSRAPPALAALSSGRRGADELFEVVGADSAARLLSAAALLLSTSEAKLSLAGGASDFATRWELWNDRFDAISDVTLTTGRLSRWTGLPSARTGPAPFRQEK